MPDGIRRTPPDLASRRARVRVETDPPVLRTGGWDLPLASEPSLAWRPERRPVEPQCERGDCNTCDQLWERVNDWESRTVLRLEAERRELEAAGIAFGSPQAIAYRFEHMLPGLANSRLDRQEIIASLERDINDLYASGGPVSYLDVVELARRRGHEFVFCTNPSMPLHIFYYHGPGHLAGELVNGNHVCPQCRATHYSQCPDCGMVTHNSDRTHRLLHRQPVPAPSRKLAQRLYKLGVELELEREKVDYNRPRTPRIKTWLESNYEWISAGTDGSLRNGIELRTAPLTLPEHLDGRWDDFFSGAVKGYAGAVEGHWGVGLHVHVCRDVLAIGEIGKMLSFINSDRNHDFINAIAGRGPNMYCERGGFGFRARYAARSLVHARGCRGAVGGPGYCTCSTNREYRSNLGRYSALNLATGGKPTIEFRLFGSTTDRDTFLARLEAVAAMIHFASETSWEHLSATDYLAWLANTPNRAYREHRAALVTAGFGTASTKVRKAWIPKARVAKPRRIRQEGRKKICV